MGYDGLRRQSGTKCELYFYTNGKLTFDLISRSACVRCLSNVLLLHGLISSLPIDRDSGRWKVDEIETQRRRELFWELFTYDSWQCWTFGRPPSFALAHFDCKMPHLNDSSDEQSCKEFLTRYHLLIYY